MSEIWRPSVTVAAVIERGGRFLLVEEAIDGRRVLNQPAGHLDPGESLVQACVREVMEETAHRFTPTSLVGIYRWHYAPRDVTFLRFTFSGNVGEDTRGKLDNGGLDGVVSVEDAGRGCVGFGYGRRSVRRRRWRRQRRTDGTGRDDARAGSRW